MLSKAYKAEVMKKSSIFEWHKWFKESLKYMDDKRSGHPRPHGTDENVEKVQNLMHSDKHLSIRAMAMQPNLKKETVKKA
jgi:hypothetical protein